LQTRYNASTKHSDRIYQSFTGLVVTPNPVNQVVFKTENFKNKS
jgi:hypothetical protein